MRAKKLITRPFTCTRRIRGRKRVKSTENELRD